LPGRPSTRPFALASKAGRWSAGVEVVGRFQRRGLLVVFFFSGLIQMLEIHPNF
jgi:hypothetical protein